MLKALLVVMTLSWLWVGHTAAAEERDVLAIVEANFKTADINEDGKLDADEFPALIDANAAADIGRASMVKRFGAYKRAFRTADKNSDGTVAWSELVTARED